MKKQDLLDKLNENSSIEDTAKEFMSLFLTEFEEKTLSSSKIKNFIAKENNPFYPKCLGPVINSSSLVRSLDSSLGNQVAILSEVILEKFGHIKPLKQLINTKKGDVEVYQVTGKLSKSSYDYIKQVCSGNVINLDEDHFKTLSKDDGSGFEIKSHFSDMILIDNQNKEIIVMECKLGGNLDVKNKKANAEALLIQKAILINTYPDFNVSHYLATQYNSNDLDGTRLKNQTVSLFGADNCLIGRQFWEMLVRGTIHKENIWENLKKGLASSDISATYGEDLLKKIQEKINQK